MRKAFWEEGNAHAHSPLDVEPMVELLLRQNRTLTDPSGYSLVPVHAWTHPAADINR